MTDNSTSFTAETEPSPITIEQFVSIVREYSGEYFTEDFADSVYVDANYQRMCCLKNGDEVISGIMYTCLDGCPHITAMATKRKYKNRGYGKQLLMHFVDHVAQQGFRLIELYAWSEKTKPVCTSVQAFYKSAGFAVVGEHTGLWERDMITVKMRRTL
ncbi:MAG: GNAT family N-acetyltransferase [Oscillospiraceae bacterium]|jgi:GNAT superfamily N-acetyltransferase|nr:GNAT family N-acetyltransferase [Oscillospiraceae bacterium]